MALFHTFVIRDFAKERYLELVRSYPRLKEEKTQLYLMLSLTFISLAFLGIFAINPTLTTITELNKKIADSTFANNALQTKITNISSLQKSYQNMSFKWPLVQAAVPDQPQVGYLLGQLQTIGADTGVIITDLQSTQVELIYDDKTNKNVLSFTFTVSAEGSKENLLQFTKTLGQFDRITTIEDITFQNEKTSVITIRGRAYFLP